MRAVFATVLFALSLVAAAPAQTTPHHHHISLHRVHLHRVATARHHMQLSWRTAHHYLQLSHRVRRYAGGDRRPARWCGWFMRHVCGVADHAFNVARNWAYWGRWAGGPRVGAVVVWRHHVGAIDGGPDGRGRWLVRSGNDGHAVRSRFQSLAGAIAFRMP